MNACESMEVYCPSFQYEANSPVIENVFKRLDLSSATLKDYKSKIGNFLEYISENKLSDNSFIQYKKYLESRIDITVSTKNKYLIVAKIFIKELYRLGIIKIDITTNVKCFKGNKKHKKFGLTEEEVHRIAERLKSLEENKRNMRLQAMLALLIFQGLRQIELVRLQVKDLDLLNGIAHIQGKGQDEKEIIYLHPSAISTINNYLKITKIKDGPLFCGFSNRKNKERISHMTLNREIKGLFSELGINKTIHGLRHFYITRLLKKSRNPVEVQKFSRHANLETLIVYDDEINLSIKKTKVFRYFSDIRLN